MQHMLIFRQWNIVVQQNNLASFEHLIRLHPSDALTTYRDNGEGWTVLEVLCHLRDFEALFLERAQLTINETFPDLPFPIPDELAVTNDYNNQPISDVLTTWRQTREQFHVLLESITDEATWERPAKHPKRGEFTLNQQFMLITWHDSNHLEQVLRILAEKR